jgi:hypothetical protein
MLKMNDKVRGSRLVLVLWLGLLNSLFIGRLLTDGINVEMSSVNNIWFRVIIQVLLFTALVFAFKGEHYPSLRIIILVTAMFTCVFGFVAVIGIIMEIKERIMIDWLAYLSWAIISGTTCVLFCLVTRQSLQKHK